MVKSVRLNATLVAEQGATRFVSEVKVEAKKLSECQRKCFLEHANTWPHENTGLV